MIKIGSIVWGVTDIERAAAFWTEALGYEQKGEMSDDWAMLVPKNGDGIQLSLSKITSPKARRHHMDLFAEDQKAEVERLISLGATRKPWNYEPGADYVVLQDPDGNPFCVVQI
ncbi:MAG: VOC family protein [Oscillospiraceae bacterium]|nr:VOC family protein [Oscillospiraceae bacterium]